MSSIEVTLPLAVGEFAHGWRPVKNLLTASASAGDGDGMETTTATTAPLAPVEYSDHVTTYVFDPVLVDDREVAAIMKAKAADLDWYRRTLRNAIRGARRLGVDCHVGRTYTQAHITQGKPTRSSGLSLDYTARPDGTLYRWVQR